jgi:hypothetical protein
LPTSWCGKSQNLSPTRFADIGCRLDNTILVGAFASAAFERIGNAIVELAT